MTTYTEATTPTDADDALTSLLAQADALGVNVAGWDPVAPQRALFTLSARAVAHESDLRVALAKAGFLQAAATVGDDFFDEALTWYGETRLPATRAVWTLRVTCAASAGPYTIGVSSGELVAVANDGTEFVNTNERATTIAAGSTVNLEFTCSTAGTVGNQSGGNITRFVVGKPGLTVTNAAPATLDTTARDQESTGDAITRVLGKWGTIGAGWTLQSFDYWIPSWHTSITRWKVRDDSPAGPGTIQFILADSAGPATSPEIAAVLAGATARNFKPVGSGAVSVVAASSVTITVTGTIYGDGTNATLLQDAKDALDALKRGFPIGGDEDGKIRLDLIKAVLMGGAWPSTAPLEINGKTITLEGFTGAKYLSLSSPAADTSLAYNEIPTFNYSGLVLG